MTIQVAIGQAVQASCCGDCPRGSGERSARLVLEAMGTFMPTPAMQRAILGEAPEVFLTGAQSAEAISRYRALLEAAKAS